MTEEFTQPNMIDPASMLYMMRTQAIALDSTIGKMGGSAYHIYSLAEMCGGRVNEQKTFLVRNKEGKPIGEKTDKVKTSGFLATEEIINGLDPERSNDIEKLKRYRDKVFVIAREESKHGLLPPRKDTGMDERIQGLKYHLWTILNNREKAKMKKAINHNKIKKWKKPRVLLKRHLDIKV